MPTAAATISADQLNAVGEGYLPGLLGIRFLNVGEGFVEAELVVGKALMAPNGHLHAGSIVTLADTACGYGCVRALPEGAAGFTTVERRAQDELYRHDARGRRRMPRRGAASRAHDAALGRRRQAPRHGQDHRAFPLHADGAVAEVTGEIAISSARYPR